MNIEDYDNHDRDRIKHFCSTLNNALLEWEASCHLEGYTGNLFGMQHEDIHTYPGNQYQIKLQFPTDDYDQGNQLGVVLTIERYFIGMRIIGKKIRWRMKIQHGKYNTKDKSFEEKQHGYLVGKNFPDLGSQLFNIGDSLSTGKDLNLQDEQSSLITLNTL